MRYMGLDVGDKTIGVAISDGLGFSAQPIEVIRRNTLEKDIQRLTELIVEYEVDGIVVGMPRNMDGSYGFRAEITKEFGENLKEAISVPVHFWDERLSTRAAEAALLEANVSRGKRKKVVDKLAAVIILQGFLDRERQKNQN